MENELKFRLGQNRKRRSKMQAKYRCFLDLTEKVTLEGVLEIVGHNERNGNIQITIQPWYESDKEKADRLKRPEPRPFKRPKHHGEDIAEFPDLDEQLNFVKKTITKFKRKSKNMRFKDQDQFMFEAIRETIAICQSARLQMPLNNLFP